MGAPMSNYMAPSVRKSGGGRAASSNTYPAFSSRQPTKESGGSGGARAGGTGPAAASWNRDGPRALTSKAGEGFRRVRGVGVNVRELALVVIVVVVVVVVEVVVAVLSPSSSSSLFIDEHRHPTSLYIETHCCCRLQ